MGLSLSSNKKIVEKTSNVMNENMNENMSDDQIIDAINKRNTSLLERVVRTKSSFILKQMAKAVRKYIKEDDKQSKDTFDYLLSLRGLNINERYENSEHRGMLQPLLYETISFDILSYTDGNMDNVRAYMVLEQLLEKGADQSVKVGNMYPLEDALDFIYTIPEDEINCTKSDISIKNPCSLIKRLILDAIVKNKKELLDLLTTRHETIYNALAPAPKQFSFQSRNVIRKSKKSSRKSPKKSKKSSRKSPKKTKKSSRKSPKKSKKSSRKSPKKTKKSIRKSPMKNKNKKSIRKARKL
jgi:hypothetical protein